MCGPWYVVPWYVRDLEEQARMRGQRGWFSALEAGSEPGVPLGRWSPSPTALRAPGTSVHVPGGHWLLGQEACVCQALCWLLPLGGGWQTPQHFPSSSSASPSRMHILGEQKFGFVSFPEHLCPQGLYEHLAFRACLLMNE